MIRGGIYDQLGGGFARYATDRAWLVPHFEKMLYDNALLVTLLSEAFQLTGERLYRDSIAETLAFVEREMTSPEGGFYSALDADSEGEEGKFYVWDKAEVDRILGQAASLFCNFYGITEEGNWEGHNILWRPHTYAEFARRHDLPEETLRPQLAQARQQLFTVRAGRVRPGLDDKCLLSWNALMCTAYAKAYAALDEEQYLRVAETNLDFLLSRFRQEDGAGYYHTYKDGKVEYQAFLEDYAFLIEALLEVYSVNFSRSLLTEAARLADLLIGEFLDADSKLFYFTSASQQDVILRKKELFDNAVPSGNSTMALNLQRLGILLGRRDYRELAADMLRQMKHGLERYPGTFSRWARAALRLVHPWHEIAVVGPEAEARARAVNRLLIPNKVIMAATEADPDLPLLRDKGAGADTKIFVCKDYACGMPVETVAEVEKQVLPEHRAHNK